MNQNHRDTGSKAGRTDYELDDELEALLIGSADELPVPTTPPIPHVGPIPIAVQVRDFTNYLVPDSVLAEVRIDVLDIADALKKPVWLGKDSLEKFMAESSLDFDCENLVFPEQVHVMSWRPLITAVLQDADSPKNFNCVTALVFNLPIGTDPADVGAKLTAYKVLMHTRYNHCPSAPAWRVVIPLKYKVRHPYWHMLMESTLGTLGLKFSDVENEPFKWFELPSCPHDAVVDYGFIELDGPLLDGEKAADLIREERSIAAAAIALANCSEVEPQPVSVQASVAIAAKVIEKAMAVLKPEGATAAGVMPSEVDPSIPASTTAPARRTEAVPISSVSILTTTVAEAMADYSFPADDTEDDLTLSDEDLRSRLENLAGKVKLAEDYLAVRNEYCSIGVILNTRGLWAPAFRNTVAIPKSKRDHRDFHNLVHRDHLVIDFHWFHAKQHDIHPSEPEWRPLFNLKSPFSFALAEEFAKKVLRSDYRANAILGITERQQVQTRSLRGARIIDRVNEIKPFPKDKEVKRMQGEMELLRLEINRWGEDDPRLVPHKAKYIAHAYARLLLTFSGPPSYKAIAELGGLIQGVAALGERTVCGLMKKLDARVAKSAARSKSA